MTNQSRWLVVLSALAASVSSSAANAEASTSEMLAVIDGGGDAVASDKVRLWINGSVSGLTWANAELESKHRPKLFCTPAQLQLTLDGDVDILRQYLKRHPNDATERAGMVMMEAMQEKFPCPKGT